MDQMRPGRGSRIARPTDRGGGADGIFDGRTIPLQLRGITALRPWAQRQHDRAAPKARSKSPWPGVIARMAEGSSIARSRFDVEMDLPATGLSGLAELALDAITDEPADVGQIIGVGTPRRARF